jgi:hypothetical protein
MVARVRKVFLGYAHLDDATWCRRRSDGMWYSGKKIAVQFFGKSPFQTLNL